MDPIDRYLLSLETYFTIIFWKLTPYYVTFKDLNSLNKHIAVLLHALLSVVEHKAFLYIAVNVSKIFRN